MLDLTSMGMHVVGRRPRVYKVARGFGCEHCAPVHKKPWNVSAPNWQHQTFATWDEAMEHALKWRPLTIMNGGHPAGSPASVTSGFILTANQIRRLEGAA